MFKSHFSLFMLVLVSSLLSSSIAKEDEADKKDKKIQIRLPDSQVAYDTDQTAFDTFVQPESIDLSGVAPE